MSQSKNSTNYIVLFDTLTIDLEWLQKENGFGQLYIHKNPNSEIIELYQDNFSLCNERLSKEKIREILYRMVDTIIEEATIAK